MNNPNFMPTRKIRTRAERLEEEQKKQEELAEKQKALTIEKVRMLKRYIISKASEQERGNTEAAVSLRNGVRELDREKLRILKEEEEKKINTDADNIMAVLSKVKIKPSKKKIIKHYMLDKLEEAY